MGFGIELGTATVLQVTGKDRNRIVNNFATQDLRACESGLVYETFVTESKGRTFGHGLVFASTDALSVVTVPNCYEKLASHIDRFVIREDVQVSDRSDAFQFWLFSDSVMAATGLGASEIIVPQGHWLEIEMADGGTCMVTSSPWTGGETLLVAHRSHEVRSIRERLGANWLQSDFANRAHWELLRIRNFWPWYGVDFDERNLPQELARDASAISFRKGCYLGQETIARLDALGQVQKKLVLLGIEGAETVASQSIVTSGETTVGTVTSSAWDADSQQTLGLAFVKRSHFRVGQSVEIGGRKGIVLR